MDILGRDIFRVSQQEADQAELQIFLEMKKAIPKQEDYDIPLLDLNYGQLSAVLQGITLVIHGEVGQAGTQQPDLPRADSEPTQKVYAVTWTLQTPGQLQETDSVCLAWGGGGNMSPVFLLLSCRKCSSFKSYRFHQGTIMLGQRRFGEYGFPLSSQLFLLQPLCWTFPFLPHI